VTTHKDEDGSVLDEWAANKIQVFELCLVSALGGFSIRMGLTSHFFPLFFVSASNTLFAANTGLMLGKEILKKMKPAKTLAPKLSP